MLEIGSFRSRSCDGLSRRSFVRAAATLPLAWGLPGAVRAVSDAGRARSVMMVWLWGGPSHIDTFDPKPDAPSGVRGPFTTIPTRVPGVRFSELMPGLARRNDRFTVVRSTRFAGNHDMVPLAGGRGRSGAEPNFGSIVARHRPTLSSGLPPFVSLLPRTTLSHGFRADSVPGSRAGRLGAAYDPFLVRCSSDGEVDLPSLKLLDGLSPERLVDRRRLQGALDDLQRLVETPEMSALDAQNESAFSMLTNGGARRAFDLSTEPARSRAAYGHTSFGQSMLLGRRLVEAGIPYVQVNWSLGVDGLEEGPLMGWDTHRNGFGQLLTHHAPVFDRAFSALLDDLSERGLLESTLVVAMGEMGRTPKINNTGGRDHWATCSTLWAGAGVGGGVHGATDAQGAEPITEPVTSLMVGTTIAEAMGIDSQARAELGVLRGGEVIRDLL